MSLVAQCVERIMLEKYKLNPDVYSQTSEVSNQSIIATIQHKETKHET